MQTMLKIGGLVLACGVAAALVGYHMHHRHRTTTPGHNRPCELVMIATGERIATTWDKVWPLKPVQSPVNGQWLVEYPAKSGQYAYVVQPGEKPPLLPATEPSTRRGS